MCWDAWRAVLFISCIPYWAKKAGESRIEDCNCFRDILVGSRMLVVHTATLCLAEQLNLAHHNASTRCCETHCSFNKVMAVKLQQRNRV